MENKRLVCIRESIFIILINFFNVQFWGGIVALGCINFHGIKFGPWSLFQVGFTILGLLIILGVMFSWRIISRLIPVYIFLGAGLSLHNLVSYRYGFEHIGGFSLFIDIFFYVVPPVIYFLFYSWFRIYFKKQSRAAVT